MITCATASDHDEPGIRALLREAAMEGRIRLSFQREPDCRLAATIEGERHHTVAARDAASGRVVGVASRAVRRRFLEGRPVHMGYLAQLRVAPGVALRRHHLEQGFALCEASRQDDELPFDFTSILAENRPARRLLERGLPGLPSYSRFAEVVTLMIPTSGRRFRTDAGVRPARPDELGEVAALLQQRLRSCDLAPMWSAEELTSSESCRGLQAGDFLVAGEGDRLDGCAAIWDQQAFKQVVVQGHAPALRWVRPMLNLGLLLAGRPAVPGVGAQVRLAHLSHLAVADGDPGTAVRLVRSARRHGARRGIDLLALGLDRRDPMLGVLRRRFPVRELASIIYLVHRDPVQLPESGRRLVQPEVAIL